MFKIILLSFFGIAVFLFLAAACFWLFSNRRTKPANKPKNAKDEVDNSLYDNVSSTHVFLSKVECDNGPTTYKKNSPDETTNKQTNSAAKTQSAGNYVGRAVWSSDKRIIEPSSSSLGWGLLAVTALGAGSGIKTKRPKRNDGRSTHGRRGIGWTSGGEEFTLGGGDRGGHDGADGGGDGGCGGGDGGGGE